MSVLILLVSLFGALATNAGAQDEGPALAISGDDVTVTEGDDGDTYAVEAAGTYDLTLSGSGFSIPVFVLQCPGAAGSLEALTEGDATALCDLGNLLPGTPDADGAFEVTFEGVEVDDCGLVFAAADAAQTEAATALLEVTNPAADAVCEVEALEGYSDEDVANTEVEGATETAEEGELAVTGANSLTLGAIGAVLLLVGGFAIDRARRVQLHKVSDTEL